MPNEANSTSNFWKAMGIAMVAVLWPYDGWINLGPVALLLLAYLGAFVSLLVEQWSQTMGVLLLISTGVVHFYVASALRRRWTLAKFEEIVA